MAITNLGRIAMIHKGSYNPATTYSKYDVVYDGESSYLSIDGSNLGNPLTNALKWQPLSKGDATSVTSLKNAINYMYPAVPYSGRVIDDGGVNRNKRDTSGIVEKFLDLLPNTKLLVCPQIGVKLRESGIYKYSAKLYDVGPGMLDGAQTTALNQPYLSGNIAPNEKFAIKNPNGGSAYLTHTPISFTATDKWSVSTVVSGYGNATNQYPYYAGHSQQYGLGLQNGSSFEIRFVNNISSASAPTKRYLGKNTVITWVSIGNGSLYAYINGELLQTFSGINTEYIESEIGRGRGGSLPYQNSGTIQYHCIRNIALSPTQVQEEYNYLRTLFPEVESVQIGTQTWATSNCEMTCTPHGNIIQEMQAAGNVEKIVNEGFDTDTEWIKMAGVTINGGTLNINSSSISSKAYQVKTISPNSYYKVTYTVLNYVSGASAISVGGVGTTGIKSGNGTYSQYFKTGASPSNVIQIWGFGSAANEFSIDNVSVQEVGWADSTNLYNELYANTTGTAEQKEYAAVKAAAMWRNVNNDPVLASIYGKKFNKYARKLLAMDIAYYNAANPTALWGWDIPTQAQLTTLASNGGNALKVVGAEYWNTPNGINSTGLTLLGGGYIDVSGNYVGNKTHEGVWSKDADIARVALDADNSFNEVEATTEGYSIRLIKQ